VLELVRVLAETGASEGLMREMFGEMRVLFADVGQEAFLDSGAG
jgi:hypothetical protein